MNILNLPARLLRAFAASGNKVSVPQTSASPYRASYESGFPALNMTPIASGGVPPYGADFNGVLFDLSQAIMWQQALGIRPFDAGLASGGGYPSGAFVTHSGSLWKCTVDNNSAAPPGAGWEKQSIEGGTVGQVLTKLSAANGDFGWRAPASIGAATEPSAGIAAIASTAEALALLIDNKIITPKKLGSVIDSLSRWMPVYKTGSALPVSNIGPIWHDDYSSVMTWQAFTANGASYTGYASQFVGTILADTQSTPRPGYIKSGRDDLSRTQYAALRAWAKHNGIMVATGTWAAGSIAMQDNPDGLTFTVFDVRGEFPRFWDDGRGADIGRQPGAYQAQQVQAHKHIYDMGEAYNDNRKGLFGQSANNGFRGTNGKVDWDNYLTFTNDGTAYSGVSPNDAEVVGAETRPRNVALLASVKF